MEGRYVRAVTPKAIRLETRDRTRVGASPGLQNIVFTGINATTRTLYVQDVDVLAGVLTKTPKRTTPLFSQSHASGDGTTPLFRKDGSTLVYEHVAQTMHEYADNATRMSSTPIGAVANGAVYVKTDNAMVVSLAARPAVRVYGGAGTEFKEFVTPVHLIVLAPRCSKASEVWLGSMEVSPKPGPAACTEATIYTLNIKTGAATKFGSNPLDVQYEAVYGLCELTSGIVVFVSIARGVLTGLSSGGDTLFSVDVTSATLKRPNSLLAMPDNNFLAYFGDGTAFMQYRCTYDDAPAIPDDHERFVPTAAVAVHEKSSLVKYARSMPAGLPKIFPACVSGGILLLMVPCSRVADMCKDAGLIENLRTPPPSAEPNPSTLCFTIGSWIGGSMLAGDWTGFAHVRTYAIILNPATLARELLALSYTLYSTPT